MSANNVVEERVLRLAVTVVLRERREVALNYDNFRDRGFQTPNTNLGLPLNGGGSSSTGFQAPRNIRMGARFEW